MTFPLEFDLLMIGVCTFIKKKTKKKREKKTNKQQKKQKKNKETKKKKKKKGAKTCLFLISYSIGFLLLGSVVGFIIGGLGEIFMRDELCESSLRSFIPWIMDDMYWI